MSTDNGVHMLSREKYDALDRINWSRLKHMGRSPAHYRHNLVTPREDTDALRLGRITHLAILEPELFASACAIWSGGVRRGKAWDAFCEENKGRELLNQEEHRRCATISALVRNDGTAGPLFSGGAAEVAALWTHLSPPLGATTGFSMDCKARLDFVSDTGAIVDLKTCRDASPGAFGRACFNLGYHVQAAFYRDGYEAATGKRLPYKVVAVETAAPHVVQVYEVPEAVLEMGREEYRTLLERLHHCRSTSRWPGYGEGEMELTLPQWAMRTDDEDLGGLDLNFNQ